MSAGDEMGERLVNITFDSAITLSKNAFVAALNKVLGVLKKGSDFATGKIVNKITDRVKVSMKKLERKGDTSIGTEIGADDLHGFKEYAKKYNLKYSFVKHKDDKEHISFFFREKDLSKLEQCLQDYCTAKAKGVDLKERIINATQRAEKINKDRKKEKTVEKEKTKGAKPPKEKVR